MNLRDLARAVARDSKHCRHEGGGIAISIWRDGTYTTTTGRQVAVARREGEQGEFVPRLLCIEHPVSAATAAEMIRQAIGRERR